MLFNSATVFLLLIFFYICIFFHSCYHNLVNKDVHNVQGEAASDDDAKDATRIAPIIICQVEHIFASPAKHPINYTSCLHILAVIHFIIYRVAHKNVPNFGAEL